jgi:hypothetical protein
LARVSEYSTVSGLTLSGYWLRNLLGGAERFRVDGVTGLSGGTGGIDYSGATYLRPCNVSPRHRSNTHQ